ncbi:MAG: ETC complex I subunit [Allosphingosinicella sp.]
MAARLYQRYRNAMQSGKARTGEWILEFESRAPKRPDPLTGWSGGADTQEQVTLTFPNLEAAKAYAEREGIDYHVIPADQPKLRLQAYADNFR